MHGEKRVSANEHRISAGIFYRMELHCRFGLLLLLAQTVHYTYIRTSGSNTSTQDEAVASCFSYSSAALHQPSRSKLQPTQEQHAGDPAITKFLISAQEGWMFHRSK